MPAQELFNCATHLLGAIVLARLSVPLICRLRRHPIKSVSLAVFACAAMLLLVTSGVYHLMPAESSTRTVFQRLDHAAIFILIAASFTPIHLLAFSGIFRWAIPFLVWSLAIAGLMVATVFFSVIPEWLSLGMYLGLGWIGLFSFCYLCFWYGLRFARDVAYGGLAYSMGAVIDFLRMPVIVPGFIGAHELFHVAVLIGIAFHWRFVVRVAVFADLKRPVPHRIRRR